MAKPHLRIKARNLREKQGFSIKEIAEIIGVGRSTTSLWCRDIKLTPKQIKRLEKKERDGKTRGRIKAAEIKKKKRLDKIEKYREKAMEEIPRLTKRELFLIGVALYWAEGSKKDPSMSLTNSDPEMMTFFIEWLQEVWRIPKSRIKCTVGINQAHKERIREVERYWSKITKIPISQFNKSSLKLINNKKEYRNFQNHNGTLAVRVLKGTNLNYQTLGWIEALKKRQGSSAG